MTPRMRSGSLPKVGGHSAASRTPSRPLVPAPRNTIAPARAPARRAASVAARAIAGRRAGGRRERAAVLVEQQRDHARASAACRGRGCAGCALSVRQLRPAAGAGFVTAARLAAHLVAQAVGLGAAPRASSRVSTCAVAHDDAALDHDVRARPRPSRRRRGARRGRRAGAARAARTADHDDVRALAGLQRADAVLHAQRPRAAEGRHLQHRGRGGDGRIAGRVLGQERGRQHLLEHVEVVVAGGAVGAQAQPQPFRQHLARPAPRPTRASCCSAGSGRRRRPPPSGCARSPGVSQTPCAPSTPLRRKPEVAQVLGGRLAVALAHLSLLVRRLGEVDEDRRAVPVGERARGAAASRGRPGRSSAAPPRPSRSGSPGPALQEALRVGERVRRSSCCRGRGTRSASRRRRTRMPASLAASATWSSK